MIWNKTIKSVDKQVVCYAWLFIMRYIKQVLN